MKHPLLGCTVIALLLVSGPTIARADESPPALGQATQDLLGALANLGVTVSVAMINELSKASEQFTKEHLAVESWRGPAIEPEEYVGGFNLKLYPKGKSQSEDHFRAETFYRLDRQGLKELEFSATRP